MVGLNVYLFGGVQKTAKYLPVQIHRDKRPFSALVYDDSSSLCGTPELRVL